MASDYSCVTNNVASVIQKTNIWQSPDMSAKYSFPDIWNPALNTIVLLRNLILSLSQKAKYKLEPFKSNGNFCLVPVICGILYCYAP